MSSSAGIMSSLEGAAYIFGAALTILIIHKLIKLILPESNQSLNMSLPDNKQRLLGTMEKVLDKGQQVHIFTTTGAFLISYNKLEYETLKSKLKEALGVVTSKQPLLRSIISENDEKKEYFKVLDCEKAVKNFQITEDQRSDWVEVMEEQMIREDRYEHNTGLQWRLILLPQADVKDVLPADSSVTAGEGERGEEGHLVCVMEVNHAIMDGVACIHLAVNLINALNEILKNGTSKPHECYPLIPPTEDYILQQFPGAQPKIMPKILRFLFKIPGMFKFFLTGAVKGNPFTQVCGTEKARNPDIDRKTCILPYCWTREETSQFLQKCKTNRCTVQGALQIAAADAYHDIIRHLNAEKYQYVANKPVKMSIPVNIRNYLGVPSDYCGNYAAAINHFPVSPSSGKDFWECARELRQKLVGKLGRNLLKETIKLAETIEILMDGFVKLGAGNIPYGNHEGKEQTEICIANIGVYESEANTKSLHNDTSDDVTKDGDGIKDSDVILEDESPQAVLSGVYTSIGIHQPLSGGVFHIYLTTLDGRMYWTLPYLPNIVKREVAQRFAENFLSILKDL